MRLCPPATHLVSVGWDGCVVLTDLQVLMMMVMMMMIMMVIMMQGDITADRASLTVARHRDKVVNVRSEFSSNQSYNMFMIDICRWHPEECSLVTSSADKAAATWTLGQGQ